MKVRVMRLLRQKHNILCSKIGEKCGVSQQRVNEIELSEGPLRTSTKRKIRKAFFEVAQERERDSAAFLQDLARHSDVLFDSVEEYLYDL